MIFKKASRPSKWKKKKRGAKQRDIKGPYIVYILKNKINEKDTYVGFTNDPLKRINQHNGRIPGGAKKTSKKYKDGTRKQWTMFVNIHGFKTYNEALAFEWALDNPRESVRYRDAINDAKLTGTVNCADRKYHQARIMVSFDDHLSLQQVYFS